MTPQSLPLHETPKIWTTILIFSNHIIENISKLYNNMKSAAVWMNNILLRVLISSCFLWKSYVLLCTGCLVSHYEKNYFSLCQLTGNFNLGWDHMHPSSNTQQKRNALHVFSNIYKREKCSLIFLGIWKLSNPATTPPHTHTLIIFKGSHCSDQSISLIPQSLLKMVAIYRNKYMKSFQMKACRRLVIRKAEFDLERFNLSFWTSLLIQFMSCLQSYSTSRCR